MNIKFKEYVKEKNEMFGIDMDTSKEFIVDPFVGCAWPWEKADELIGHVYEVKNGWFAKDGCFLMNEGDFKFIS